MNDLSTWLYPKNAAFWTDKTGLPANYDEIVEQLRTKYGVIDLPPLWRIMLSIVAFVIALILIICTCLLVMFILDHFSNGTLTVREFLINAFLAIPIVLGAYLFSFITFALIAHRQAAVEKSWSDLSSKGIVLEGKIKSVVHQNKTGDRKLKYEFFDSDGKRRIGYYSLRPASIAVGDKVVVWYVHRKLHTLL